MENTQKAKNIYADILFFDIANFSSEVERIQPKSIVESKNIDMLCDGSYENCFRSFASLFLLDAISRIGILSCSTILQRSLYKCE